MAELVASGETTSVSAADDALGDGGGVAGGAGEAAGGSAMAAEQQARTMAAARTLRMRNSVQDGQRLRSRSCNLLLPMPRVLRTKFNPTGLELTAMNLLNRCVPIATTPGRLPLRLGYRRLIG